MELVLTDRLKRQPSPLLKRRFPRINFIGTQNLADAFKVDPGVPDTTIVGIRECDINLLLGQQQIASSSPDRVVSAVPWS